MSVRSAVSRISRHSFSLVDGEDSGDGISDLEDDNHTPCQNQAAGTVYEVASTSDDGSRDSIDSPKKSTVTERVCAIETNDYGSQQSSPLSVQTFTIKRKPLPPQVSSTTTAPPSEKGQQKLVIPLMKTWTPIWLGRTTLFGFFTLFVCSATALIALWRIAAVQNGLSVAASQNEYYWKYGPTASRSCLSRL